MSYLYIDYTNLLEVSRMREIVSGILDTNCDAVVRWQKYNNLLFICLYSRITLCSIHKAECDR